MTQQQKIYPYLRQNETSNRRLTKNIVIDMIKKNIIHGGFL
jgi:hypothetical protein